MCAWNSIGETIEELVTVELHMRTYRMIESTPSLLAAHLRRCADLENQIALLIAGREGLDVDEDPRPRVAVAAFFGVMRVTGQLWGRGRESGVDSLRALTEVYLDQLGPALVEATGVRNQARRPGSGAGPGNALGLPARRAVRLSGAA